MVVAGALFAAGCAGADPIPPLPGSPCLASGPRSEFVSGDELAALQGATLYELLEKARPLWLFTGGDRARSIRVRTETAVITNGQYLGGLSTLRSLPPRGVHSIRRVTGTRAANGVAGFASDVHIEAAILVSFGCSGV